MTLCPGTLLQAVAERHIRYAEQLTADGFSFDLLGLERHDAVDSLVRADVEKCAHRCA